MADREVEVRNVEMVSRYLLGKGLGVKQALREGLHAGVIYLHGSLPDESSIPKPAGSKYQRTGLMMRSITEEVRSLGEDQVGVLGVGKVAPYGPWVISSEVARSGSGPQARIHQGRWFTLQGKLKEEAHNVFLVIQAVILKFMNQ
jgi:hypothetical protein